MALQVDTSGLRYRVVQSWGDTSGVTYGCTPLDGWGCTLLGWSLEAGITWDRLLGMNIPGVDFIDGHIWARPWGCEILECTPLGWTA